MIENIYLFVLNLLEKCNFKYLMKTLLLNGTT